MKEYAFLMKQANKIERSLRKDLKRIKDDLNSNIEDPPLQTPVSLRDTMELTKPQNINTTQMEDDRSTHLSIPDFSDPIPSPSKTSTKHSALDLNKEGYISDLEDISLLSDNNDNSNAKAKEENEHPLQDGMWGNEDSLVSSFLEISSFLDGDDNLVLDGIPSGNQNTRYPIAESNIGSIPSSDFGSSGSIYKITSTKNTCKHTEKSVRIIEESELLSDIEISSLIDEELDKKDTPLNTLLEKGERVSHDICLNKEKRESYTVCISSLLDDESDKKKVKKLKNKKHSKRQKTKISKFFDEEADHKNHTIDSYSSQEDLNGFVVSQGTPELEHDIYRRSFHPSTETVFSTPIFKRKTNMSFLDKYLKKE
eukprot:GHVP01042942.1.p2 GENE.GHVP01042942.1~~GHVP01042942.1.p2  ORF type:complete len:368 (-),score=68.81 GHVP01042942.1:8188-9291(-)